MSGTRGGVVGVGIAGFGFMGQTHARAVAAATKAGLPCRLAAVFDRSADRLTGDATVRGNLGGGGGEKLFDPAGVHATTDLDALLRDERVHMVCVCTYTDTHVEIAERALAAGKHVLVEKPVALSAAEVERLARKAAESGRMCVPAMCMRFWPGWDWLHDAVRSGRYGAVRSATFERMGAGPGWSAEFYKDETRSGGVMFDLHIHDADIVQWLFGEPDGVWCSGTRTHFTTLYTYANGPGHVRADAAWDLAPAAGFRMKYLVTFERATAEFDLSRERTVLLSDANGTHAVDLPGGTGYERQMEAVVKRVAGLEGPALPTLAEAARVTRMLEREREMLTHRQPRD